MPTRPRSTRQANRFASTTGSESGGTKTAATASAGQPPAEVAQVRHQVAIVGIEMGEAPVHGDPQGAPACWQIPWCVRQLRILAQLRQDLGWCHHVAVGRDQFDGQRQAVQPAAHLSGRAGDPARSGTGSGGTG